MASPRSSSACSGLSPRIRGTAGQCAALSVLWRFIPAYTGNGFTESSDNRLNAVYPRVYGERCNGSTRSPGLSGLSPRIRGTGYLRIPEAINMRFIPAYTGNGKASKRNHGITPVYPRVYGERAPSQHEPHQATGLSPRIRGTAPPHPPSCTARRFIPAYTGNGSMCQNSRFKPPVYPRVYGERDDNYRQRIRARGLSPRIRGTAQQQVSHGILHRFIPAYTGNGERSLIDGYSNSVYPRVYGERRSQCQRHQMDGGLSPRIRGTATAGAPRWPWLRFIPAYTGNGHKVSDYDNHHAVYPRVYGERSWCKT